VVDRRRAPRIVVPESGNVRSFLDGAPPASADPRTDPIARARIEGEAEGRRQLRAEIDRERAAEVREVKEALARLADLEETLTRRREAVLLEIALEAASRIVREKIDAADPVALRAIQDAMDSLPGSTSLRARLHPGDLELLARELKGEIDRGRLELVPDEAITRGGCVVESAVGTVDATIETALDSLRAASLGSSVEPA
jgi:flagellar assembly protein FliH